MRFLRAIQSVVLVLFLFAVAGCDRCEQAERVCCPCEAPRPTTSTVSGTITYEFDPPPLKLIQIPGGGQVIDERLIVNPANRGIQNAIVRIMVEDKSPAPVVETPPTINMKGFCFSPHVVLVAPSSDVVFLNPDRVLHNIHGLPYDVVNKETNRMIHQQRASWSYGAMNLAAPEIIEITDDIYSWMRCFIVVHDPRYAAISDANGKFEIKDIPAGRYKVNVYQESCGMLNFDLDARPGKTEQLDIIMRKQRRH